MKILSLDLNKAVLVGGMKESLECFQEILAILNRAQTLLESLKDWKEESNVEEEIYNDVQLVNCEGLLEVLTTPGIDTYQMASLSYYTVLFERLEQFSLYRDQLVELLTEIVDAYINLSDQERNVLRDLTVSIVRQLSFFVFYEYSFDKTLTSITDSEDIEVYETVNQYCGKENKSVEAVVLFVSEIFRKYRLSIPSFDLDDETIDNFYFFAGMYGYEVLENIDQISVQDIIDIANETVSVEDVVAKLSKAKTDTSKGVNKLEVFG